MDENAWRERKETRGQNTYNHIRTNNQSTTRACGSSTQQITASAVIRLLSESSKTKTKLWFMDSSKAKLKRMTLPLSYGKVTSLLWPLLTSTIRARSILSEIFSWVLVWDSFMASGKWYFISLNAFRVCFYTTALRIARTSRQRNVMNEQRVHMVARLARTGTAAAEKNVVFDLLCEWPRGRGALRKRHAIKWKMEWRQTMLTMTMPHRRM